MKKHKNSKQWIVKCMVVLILVLLVCTAAAKTIKNLLLPRVETTSVYGGSLEDKAQLDGTVVYEGMETLWALGSWKILEVYVQEGQTVEEGAQLFRVDTSAAGLTAREYELEKDKLLHERNTSGTRWSRVREIDTEREILDEKIQALMSQYPEDGIVKADKAATIEGLKITPGMEAAEGTAVLDLLPADTPKTVRWEMTDEALQRFAGMETIQLYFIADTGGERSYKSEEIAVEKEVFNKEKGVWEVSGKLPDTWNQSEISKVQVLLNYESISYPLIIPAECVTERNGQYYVYTVDTREGVFGDESVVQETEISVLEKNDRQVAAEATGITEGQRLVKYSDKVLKDKESVSVVAE
jgi:multidrug efflux pump subunit AcrA (membrane-fusion protein)